MNQKMITDIVYDKLMGNSDLLNLNQITEQEVNAKHGLIYFKYANCIINIQVSCEPINK